MLTEKLHGPWIAVLYAWMNCYGTLLHKITPDIYIVVKVEYTLFAQSNNNNNNNNNNNLNIKILTILTLKDFQK